MVCRAQRIVLVEGILFTYPVLKGKADGKESRRRSLPFICGYVKSIPSTKHHKNGYWWRRRGVWVAASVFLKMIRCALHIIYTVNYDGVCLPVIMLMYRSQKQCIGKGFKNLQNSTRRRGNLSLFYI